MENNYNNNPYYNQNNKKNYNKRQNDSNYNAIEECSNYEEDNFPQDLAKEMRNSFIKKVFAILALQLVITAAFCVISASIKDISHFLINNKLFLNVIMFVGVIIMLCLVCYQESSKKVPLNYILLFSFTVCEAYLTAYLCVTTDPRIVFMTLALTFTIVIGLILYATFTKTDFTGHGHYLFIFSIIMLFCGLFLSFSNNKVLHVVYSGIGVMLFSIYLIYDIQLLIGNRSNKLDYDEYVIGSLMIYIDILNIFHNLLNTVR